MDRIPAVKSTSFLALLLVDCSGISVYRPKKNFSDVSSGKDEKKEWGKRALYNTCVRVSMMR
jgi:hypothetical protein